eukprot:gnl/MRDRNA2_/MRDRNA2_28358_c0_seq1.p1 gnl/MRDRNA2_/MRDRNA2_28358_c0~~gnl/MRDRNA2_/MRDRNA2_28358_c0_seq1.p1  ORF type:complete len:200 (+),score=47.83 gnl/MRDRNA2_/MRDRNA2_28358_c0_seq1:69-668(+)
MVRFISVILLAYNAQAIEIVGQGLSESSSIAMGWRSVWSQSVAKVEEGRFEVDSDLAAEAEKLAEYYTHSPEELEVLAHEMHESYEALCQKGDKVLVEHEHGKAGDLDPLKALLAAARKHMKTLDAMKRGTASGQAFLESRAGPKFLSKVCDLMVDTECLVGMTLDADDEGHGACREVFGTICKRLDNHGWHEDEKEGL